MCKVLVNLPDQQPVAVRVDALGRLERCELRKLRLKQRERVADLMDAGPNMRRHERRRMRGWVGGRDARPAEDEYSLLEVGRCRLANQRLGRQSVQLEPKRALHLVDHPHLLVRVDVAGAERRPVPAPREDEARAQRAIEIRQVCVLVGVWNVLRHLHAHHPVEGAARLGEAARQFALLHEALRDVRDVAGAIDGSYLDTEGAHKARPVALASAKVEQRVARPDERRHAEGKGHVQVIVEAGGQSPRARLACDFALLASASCEEACVGDASEQRGSEEEAPGGGVGRATRASCHSKSPWRSRHREESRLAVTHQNLQYLKLWRREHF